MTELEEMKKVAAELSKLLDAAWAERDKLRVDLANYIEALDITRECSRRAWKLVGDAAAAELTKLGPA